MVVFTVLLSPVLVELFCLCSEGFFCVFVV